MKALYRKYYLDLFLASRLFAGIALCVTVFLFAFFLPVLQVLAYVLFCVLLLLLLIDMILMFCYAKPFDGARAVPERLSNGDDNTIMVSLENRYPFSVDVLVIDELPYQFQIRDQEFLRHLKAKDKYSFSYLLRPVKRGEYNFGLLRAYVSSPIGLIRRRFNFGSGHTVPVYPSFLQLRKYELMAISNRLPDAGNRRIRRIGQSLEFEQVRNYVQGDDYRKVNWKATARRAELMTNSFIDEKTQHVYCIVDKSRNMKMPFDGMTLLDYAINASLALSDVVLLRDDKAGLITFAEKSGTMLPADRRPGHLGKIMSTLYNEKTRYLESDMEALFVRIRTMIRQRSLLILFTNFEGMQALRRQLPYLRRMSKYHLLLVVFFENTELRSLTESPATDVEGIYVKTIAEKFAHEKKMMVRELENFGITGLLTKPRNLSADVINKYLEIKARRQL